MRGERGFALVITLIVTALLVALMVEFVNETYVGTVHSHNFVASQQAGLLSESGASLGRKLLEFELGFAHPGYSSLQDMWAKPLEREDETGKLTVTIEEESGKLNLNTIGLPKGPDTTNFPMAQELFRQLKLAPELLDAVVDWIGDPTVAPQPNGAKSPYYNTLKPPYDAKGDKLDSVEELGLVKGFTPEIVAKLKPYVTVFGGGQAETSTKINVNTAPREVLAALDPKMTDDYVSRILEWRKTKPIKNLNEVPGLDAVSAAVSLKVGYQGCVYRIRSQATVGESVGVTEAVVRVSGSSSDILYWRQY
ncbi:type II secretion system minor pseudopilin GspK [Geomesophilobacter sediminis]|uniref:Type II secretion system minor pseudopilin GspK n=1 Tax=Geomesophilobacter sediminis TaxID=2798584 RepID=A0A8J7M112_9BACT|nr:type II secretion system minor pseudopilin GspK [Geomesophilobacter sediminis]MBJ6726634.1 type II secretion system minor pseudopilin GspK [Geomesophilobacter sediminis]